MHRVISASVSSLAAVRPGDEVRIWQILSESLRAHCEALDFKVGDVVHCRAAGRGAMLLDTPGGRVVSLDTDRARFIRVSPSDGPGDDA